MHSGIKLLEDTPGLGPLVKRHLYYRIRLRAWLNRGQPVTWHPMVLAEMGLEDEGQALTTTVRIDRVNLINGLFYGVEGMRIGGTRKLKISPHLAYGMPGIPGLIPPNSVFVAEITILEEMNDIFVSRRPTDINGIPIPFYDPISSLRELANSDPPICWAAIQALGYRGNDEAREILEYLCGSKDPYVRRAAVEAFSLHIGGSAAVEVICRLLDDANEYVVRAACQSAGTLVLHAAHDRVLRLVHSTAASTRTCALATLAAIAIAGDFSIVLKCFQSESHTEVRKQAGWFLLSNVQAGTAAQLFSAFYRDITVRHRIWACDLAIGFGVGSEADLNLLLADPDGHVRSAAESALSTRT